MTVQQGVLFERFSSCRDLYGQVFLHISGCWTACSRTRGNRIEKECPCRILDQDLRFVAVVANFPLAAMIIKVCVLIMAACSAHTLPEAFLIIEDVIVLA